MTQPNKNQSNLGYKVTTRNISWLDLATRAWGSEFRAPDHGVYEFSNGRKYDSTDTNQSGFYNGGVDGYNYLMLYNGGSEFKYQDMAPVSHLLQDNGDRLILE